MAPKNPQATVLNTEEEAIIVALGKHTLLLLDDYLYALQSTIPRLNIFVVASLSATSWHLSPAGCAR